MNLQQSPLSAKAETVSQKLILPRLSRTTAHRQPAFIYFAIFTLWEVCASGQYISTSIENKQYLEMKRKRKESVLLIIAMTLFLQFGFSQDRIDVPTYLYKKFPEKDNGNYLLSTHLSTNNCDLVFLDLKNNTNDTITIFAYFVLEWPKERPYILFCLSDSLLRKQPNESGFDFSDVNSYYYSNRYLGNVDIITNRPNYEELIFCDIEQARQNDYSRLIYPKDSISIPIRYYFEDRYMFLRFQTSVFIKNNWFWIQKETNGVFMPKCKKKNDF